MLIFYRNWKPTIQELEDYTIEKSFWTDDDPPPDARLIKMSNDKMYRRIKDMHDKDEAPKYCILPNSERVYLNIPDNSKAISDDGDDEIQGFKIPNQKNTLLQIDDGHGKYIICNINQMLDYICGWSIGSVISILKISICTGNVNYGATLYKNVKNILISFKLFKQIVHYLIKLNYNNYIINEAYRGYPSYDFAADTKCITNQFMFKRLRIIGLMTLYGYFLGIKYKLYNLYE